LQQNGDIAFDVLPLDQAIQSQMTVLDITVSVFAAFGIGSVFLAAVGIFGMSNTSVRQRIREIGLRLALGAQKGDIVRLILQHNSCQLSVGISMGIALSYLLGKALMFVFPGMTPNSLISYFALCAGLVVVTLSAAVLPTMKALQSDPISALRED